MKHELQAMKLREVDQFWSNAIDSIRHALDHVHELSGQTDHPDEVHHQKWFVVSVALAVESFFKAVLLQADEKIADGNTYHSLPKAIAALKSLRLPKSESRLVKIAEEVSTQRDQILHKPYDPKLELSFSAILLLCLVHMIERRVGDRPKGILGECQMMGGQIVPLIRTPFQAKYEQIVDLFLKENHPDQFFDSCPYCGANSVMTLANECVMCFADLERSECDQCGFDYLFLSGEDDPGCESCSRQSAKVELIS